MEVEEAPATPTGETFEMFDGGSAIQNRKRRRSSLRRVSFAEQPSIHVFARDDDYETPPEGTVSHLSTPTTSVSARSPQRRSGRLLASATRGARQQDENEVDKENALVGVGSNARQSRRGRRPLAVRDTQKKKAEEEFLKPSNWLDDHENSALGSCDDNSGPVDIRHITFDNQTVDAEDDMTMDSQTFHTRMSLMKRQPLSRLSEVPTTTGTLSDMESIHGQHTEKFQAWHEKEAGLGSRVSGQVQPEEPTWHRGDGRVSDMSESSFDELSILRVLAKKRTAATEWSIRDSADTRAEEGAHSQERLSSMEIIRTGSRLLDMDDDAVSSSPQPTGGRPKSLAGEMELDPDTTSNLRDSELQGIHNIKQQGQPELQARDGFVSQGIEPETVLSAPDENTESMVITLAWNERAPPQHTSVPTKSSDAAKSFLWMDKDQSMDMSDVDTMEKYQEGITEAMPKLASVLGGYQCDSPSAEPLSRILQRKGGIIDGEEDSPVYGVTAEIDTVKKGLSSRKGGDVASSGGLEEKEIVPAYRGLEDGTDEFHFNTVNKRSGFQNPEDTFSFKGHRKNTREASVSPVLEQNATNSEGRGRVTVTEANLSVPQNPGRSFLDEDSTGEYTGRDDWRADVSSDMSTTPLSPRVNYFQRLGTKAQTVPETGLTDSPTFQDGITAAIPNVQDLLAADARTPASELGWNPRKIDWGAQESTRKVLRDEEVLRQPGMDQIEDETMHSMPDRLCTPPSQAGKNHAFEDMTDVAANTLHEVSHSKEIRNSVASKMLLRMMSLQGDARAQAESSSDEDFQQSLRRTLQFQPETDSQLQSQSLRGDHAEQQMDPDVAMEVESSKNVDANVDEETHSTESNVETFRQESRRQKLLQEIQVAEERLLVLERRSEELRDIAKDCHKVVAERCRNDSCFKANESPASCSEAHVRELKRRCHLLTCILGSDLKTTKTGNSQVLHEFRYWSLLTHSIFERKENRTEATASRISIDLYDESINQVYRDMNASLAWRWFLSANEEVIQPQSLFYHSEGVNLKVVMLMDLMEEVNKCRKYLVIPRFRLQEGGSLYLGLQFSNSELLFDFLLLLNMRQVNHMRYATQGNQRLDCMVEMESAGRYFGRKITEAEIKSAVASVVPGRQLLLRVCASITALMMRNKE